MCNIWYIPAQTAIYWLPRSGELQTQKLKSHLVRTKSLKILPLKPGVSQDIAIHATLTARDFFLAYFYHSGLFTCIFPKTSQFFLCWLWLRYGSCVGLQNKLVTLPEAGSCVECLWNINRLKTTTTTKQDLWYDDL